MIIGVPKEIMSGEDRVAATPETVADMVGKGLTVLVEKGAGEGSFFHDPEYVSAGAEMVDDPEEVYQRADLILKVKEPLFNEAKGRSEISMMHKGQYLITFIHPAAPPNHEMVKEMAAQGVISLTLDGVPRISRAQNLDALTSMSTCAGYKGILLAANYQPSFMPLIHSAIGRIDPLKVLVVGVGVGGLQALATAKRLGAVVHAADIRPMAAEQATSLGAKPVELGVDPEKAIGEGGYAQALPEDELVKERAALAKVIPDMDIIFASALVPGHLAPRLITEDMVKSMKPGSVIVDISIDQGGNCEITPPGKVEVKHHVTLVGIKNIPGMLPKSSTFMFAKNIANFVDFLVKDGQIVLDRSDEIIAKTLTTIDGEIVHVGAREAMGLA
ncbi:NAD(P) transhydrogenase subunit alpha [uncultured Mobiluncus sp.]|uniref:NAD(P) transhydrogenase subunit alpha n=1 Tax=uncultured Mobiluncus sp. TaxID=293425 RepID=UPI00262B3507|nr:NAD(P) transhydrogenase subunit alpha [uncultured Mobiluncus sp.]